MWGRCSGVALACQTTSQDARWYATKPDATVYSGPSASKPDRVSLRQLRKKYAQREKLSMVTAYDYPSAAHVRSLALPCAPGQHDLDGRIGASLTAMLLLAVIQGDRASCACSALLHPMRWHRFDEDAI